MKSNRLLLVMGLVLMAVPLAAQGYQTSFSEVKFNRVQGPASLHSGVEVDAATGAVSQQIPFGPGIGTKGAHFTPTFTYRLAPQFKAPNNPSGGQFGQGYHASFTPGYLNAAVEVNGQDDYFVAGGPSAEFRPSGGATYSSQADLTKILSDFGYGSATGAQKSVGSHGELFIYFTADSVSLPSWGEPGASGITILTCHQTPKKILLVSANGETAYEFSFAQAVYQTSANLTFPNPCLPPPVHELPLTFTGDYEPHNLLLNTHYLITAISNRFGDSLKFNWASSGAFNGTDYKAEWFRNGLTTGVAVEVSLAFQQGATGTIPSFSTPSQPPTTIGKLLIKYTGFTQTQYEFQAYPQKRGTAIGTAFPLGGSDPVLHDHFLLDLQPEKITVMDSGEFQHFTYNRVGAWSLTALKSIEFNNRQIDLTWEAYNYHMNTAIGGGWGGYQIDPYFPWQQTVYGVTSIKDKSLTDSTIRSTTYARLVPVPDFSHAGPAPFWTSVDFKSTRTNPDGTVDLYRFASPINGSVAGPSASLADQMQTVAHLKHVLLEERHYASNADLNADSPYKTFKYGGGGFSGVTNWNNLDWGFYSMLSPAGQPSWESYPLKTEIWEKEGTSVRYTKSSMTDWSAVKAGWGTSVSEIQQGGPTAQTKTVKPALDSDFINWFPGRTAGQSNTTISNYSSYEGPPTVNSSVVITYLPGSLLVDKSDLIKNGFTLTTQFGAYQGQGPLSLTLSSSPALVFSGSVGVTSYQYDTLGLMKSIQLKGESFSRSQEQDAAGRPYSQTDPNNIKVGIEWDSLGRLHAIRPPNSEVPTIITYSDLLTTQVVRGAQSMTYHYNGFGELTSVDREGGKQTYTYDSGGRKRWESTWNGGTQTGTSYSYDNRGRLTFVTDPNGVVHETRYNGFSKKEIQGSEITSFDFDPLGRPSQVTDAMGQITEYKWDDEGKIKRVIQWDAAHARSQQRAFGYHPLGWLQDLVQPESGTTHYDLFTVFGKPTQAIYGYGSSSPKTVNIGYSLVGNMLGQSSTDGSVDQSFAYSLSGHGLSNGRLSQATDHGVTQSYEYWGLNGRLSDLTTTLPGITAILLPSQKFSQWFGYDTYGFRTSAMLPSKRVLTFQHDIGKDLAQNVRYAYNAGELGLLAGALYDFNPAYSPTHIRYGSGALATLSYGYDQTRLASQAHNANVPGGPLKQWFYHYYTAADRNPGRLKDDGEDSFTYDDLGRLTTAAIVGLPDATGSRPTITQAFGYDAFGNRVSSTFPLAPVPSNLAKNLVATSFSVTDNAWLKNRLPGGLSGAVYSDLGFLTQINKRMGDSTSLMNLTYDALGRVVTSEDMERSAVEVYTYNAEGLRHMVEYYKSGTLQKIRYNLYNDQRQLVSQFDWLPDASNPPSLSMRLGGPATPRSAVRNGGAK